MRTRTFSSEEKEEIKQQMIEKGLPLLKAEGILHMSITKLTQAVGIGKSTFYNFYSSKEEFVEDMMQYHRTNILKKFEAGLDGKAKYSKEEGKEIVRNMIINANNLYANFSLEDENALKRFYENKQVPYLNLGHEIIIMQHLFTFVEGIRREPDYAVIANLIKVIVFTSEQKSLLHEEGYQRTIDLLVESLLSNIFVE